MIENPTSGIWLPIAEVDNSIATVQTFAEAGITLRNSDPVWVRDQDGRVFEAVWTDHRGGYWWDIEGESPADPIEFMPHPLDPRFTSQTEGQLSKSASAPVEREENAPMRDEHGKWAHRGRRDFITGCPCLPCQAAAAFWMFRSSDDEPSRAIVSGERKVIGSGIQVGGHHYGSSRLIEGTAVFACLDPEHSGRALIFSADRTQYIGDAICPELACLGKGGQ